MAYKNKEDQAKSSRKHYLNNKEKIKQRTQNKRKEFNEWFDNLKQSFKCKLCSESRHWVLDFQHRDPKTKEDKVSKIKRTFDKEKVLKEIEKCDILCANCHRDLHYQENKLRL